MARPNAQHRGGGGGAGQGRNRGQGNAGNGQNRKQQVRRQAKRERREEKQRARFLRTPTPKQAMRQAQAEANVVYRPQERKLAAESRASAKREGDLGGWYGDLSNQVGSSIGAAQSAYQQGQQALTERADAANKQDAAVLAGLQAEDSKMAERLGGSPNVPILAQLAAGNSQAATNRVTLAQPLAQEGINYVNYLGTRRQGTTLQGIQARQEEAARRRKIREDIGAAKKERGQNVIENLARIREGARDFSVQTSALGSKDRYSQAIENQARMGLKGSRASAGAQVAAAQLYSRAKERGASIQKEVARLNKEGKHAMAKALVQQARINQQGGGVDQGGYNAREAAGMLNEYRRSNEEGFKNRRQAENYLINRGVDAAIAKKAVGNILRQEKKRSGPTGINLPDWLPFG